MRDFVSMAVRGNSEFARWVTDFAKRQRGKPASDYIRELIQADAGQDFFVAKDARQNEQAVKSTSKQYGSR